MGNTVAQRQRDVDRLHAYRDLGPDEVFDCWWCGLRADKTDGKHPLCETCYQKFLMWAEANLVIVIKDV